MATAIQEPMPGRAMLVLPTLMASEMVTKNQPPDMLIIMFQISDGVAKGASMRQKRAQADQAEHAARFLQFFRHGAQRSGRS